MVIHQADKLQLNLLGNFSLVHPDGFEIIIRGQRKKAFITLIALSPGKEISRDKLISKLWGKRSLAQARASLRTLLNELGKTFKDSGYELVKKNSEKHSLFIDQNIVQIDVERFAEVANSHTEERRRQVMEIYRGDLHEHCKLNEDAYQEWLAIERIQQRDLLRDTLLDLQDYYLRAAAHDQVIKIANRLLTLEKTDEKAHQALMLAFSAQGDKAAALKQYQVCFDATMALVNEPPSTGITETFNQIKSPGQRSPDAAIAIKPPRSLTQSNSSSLSVGVVFFRSPESILADVDQVVTDVINALARFKWMAVVPQGTMLSFRNQSLTAVEIGRSLKIQYILDGNGRDSSSLPVLSVELIDVVADSILWGDSYHLTVPYEVSVSELLVGKIVNQIEMRLRSNEVQRVLGSKDKNPSAYDSTWHAISNMYEMTESSFESARQLFEQAERENIQYAPIYSWWALWQIFCVGQGWAKNLEVESHKAFDLARKANRIDNDDALALAIMGHCEAFLNHHFNEALDCFEESLELNPNSAFAWTLSAATYSYQGEPEESLRRLDHAEQLCPIEPHFGFLFDTAKTIAYTFSKNYKEAVRWGRKTIRKNPHFSNGYKPLIASLGHMGEITEAREYLRRLLELEGNFTVERFVRQYPFKHDADRAHYVEGLLKAGVPENNRDADQESV
jgi:DNA-binding SARP family transcriptional activator/TolB-like protein/Tfp pilus assembly protein PilF